MDYSIVGGSMQILNINLKTGDKIYVDGGKVASRSEDAQMNAKWAGGAGFLKGVEMAFSGTTTFLLEVTGQSDTSTVAVSGDIPGKVRAVELKEGESMYVEHEAFLATNDPSKIDVTGSARGLMAGTGLFLEKFTGPCMVFVHVAGDIIEYDLQDGYTMLIDTGHLATFGGNMQIHLVPVGDIKAELFGHENFLMAKFTGPGKIIMHSVSRQRLAASLGRGNPLPNQGGMPGEGPRGGLAAGLAAGFLGGERKGGFKL